MSPVRARIVKSDWHILNPEVTFANKVTEEATAAWGGLALTG